MKLGPLLVAFCVVAGAQRSSSTHSPVRLPIREGSDIRFAHLSTEDGLSHSRVEHITQDDKGFLWFATGDGLNRYDGYGFKVFKHDASNPNTPGGAVIRALFKDRSGILWLGADQFLDRFDPATEHFTHFRLDPKGDAGPAGLVFSICQDRDGALWMATSQGLSKLDVSGRFSSFHHVENDRATLSSDDLTFVMEDRNGTLLVASTAGLDEFDPRSGKAARLLDFRTGRESDLHPDVAMRPDIALLEDRDGLIWIIATSGSGIASFDRHTHQLVHYTFHEKEPDPTAVAGVTAILEDDDGSLWFATVGNGLIQLDKQRTHFTRYRNRPGLPTSLSNSFLFTLFADREGSLWVGTGGGGADRFPMRRLPFHTYQQEPGNPESLDQNFTISVYKDRQGVLWVGNASALNRIDRKTGSFLKFRHQAGKPGSISNSTVTSMAEDHNGTFWLGTYGGGLNRYDPRTQRFVAYRNNPADPASLSSDRIMKLFIDHSGQLWIAAGTALNRFDTRNHRVEVFRPPAPSIINDVVEARDGTLWFATYDEGLGSLDPRTGRFSSYKATIGSPVTLSNNQVNALCLDGSGDLWLGTQSGLDRFDPRSGSFTSVYYERDGLANNAVMGIEHDGDGNLWLSTGNGLSRFEPATRRFRNYYEADGLSGNDFGVFFKPSFTSPDGEMFFGGTHGLTSFYPRELAGLGNAYVPPVVLTDLRLKNESVPIGSSSLLQRSIPYQDVISLDYGQKVFSVEFSSLSYFSPRRNRYRYRLEGLSEQWYEAGSDHRIATYTTLPAGIYTLHVQGTNNAGIWNETGTSLRIIILPPWWNTWWFRALCAVGLLSLVLAFYRFRMYQLQEGFNIRMEERIRERNRIARDLHDTLLQGFLSASMQLQVANDQVTEQSPAKPTLEKVVQLMSRVIEEGRASLRQLRNNSADTDDLETALTRIESEFGNQCLPAIQIVVEGTRRCLQPAIRDELYWIGREAIINAFRHAKAKHVEVEIEYSGSGLRLIVRDDGAGISQEVMQLGRDGHWGLAVMRERAESIGGGFRIWGGRPGGTEVVVTVPADVAFGPETLGKGARSPFNRVRLWRLPWLER